MTAHFTIDFEDLLALQKDVIRTSHTHMIKKKYFKWITSIIIFLAALLIVKNTWLTFAVILVITAVYFYVFPLLYNGLAFMKLKNQLEKNDYSHVLGDCKMTVSDKGIHRELNGLSSHFEWTAFERVNEDSRHYFLYVSDLQGLIIAKTPAHLDGEETAVFHQLIHDYMQKKN